MQAKRINSDDQQVKVLDGYTCSYRDRLLVLIGHDISANNSHDLCLHPIIRGLSGR